MVAKSAVRSAAVTTATRSQVAPCPRTTPRELTFVTVKRTGPRLREPYGHWWVEVGRKESYGWWPDRPLALRHWFTGTGGCLNGTWFNSHASPTRDALHRVPADHRFHPMLLVDNTDEQVLVVATFQAPSLPGDYIIEWDMISEFECWFAECGSSTLRTRFHVTE